MLILRQGGRVYSSVADSTTVTNIATATLTDTTYVIPADTIESGTVIEIIAVCRSIAFNSTEWQTYALQLKDTGTAETLVTSSQVTNGGTAPDIGANGRVVLKATCVARANPGASVGLSVQATAQVNDGTNYTMGPAAGAVTTYDTTHADGITVQVLVDHQSQSVNHQSVLESLIVAIY